MFLSPGTRYEFRLSYDDPDNTDARDGEVHTFTGDTLAIPSKPTGTTFYVDGDAGGGGDGSSGSPWDTIEDCDANLSAGQTCLLRASTNPYSGTTLNTAGSAGNYIVYSEDPADPGAVIESGLNCDAADYIWIDGLTFTWDDPTSGATPIEDQSFTATSAMYTTSGNSCDDVIFTANTVTGYFNALRIGSFAGSERWIVMDNDFTGSYAAGISDVTNPGTTDGHGIWLGGDATPGVPNSIIAYNNVKQYADCIGIDSNSDAYGNKCHDFWASNIEASGAFEHVRVWGNILYSVSAYNIEYQPMREGPWWFLYNQIADGDLGLMKWRVQDRLVFVGNSIMSREQYAQNYMRTYSRNNLHIYETTDLWRTGDQFGSSGCTIPNCIYRPSVYDADWFTDVDYDGFDWGGSGRAFWWDGNSTAITSIAGLFTEAGIQQKGIEVDADSIFVDKSISQSNPQPLTLDTGTNAAVDAGVVVPNLADWQSDGSPDLGAQERGMSDLHYGPRNLNVELNARTEYWTKH